MQERLARRRFFGAAATLALVGSASVRAWLDRAVVASPLPPGDRIALDSTPTHTPTPLVAPTPIPTPVPAPPVAPAPITSGVGVAVTDAVAPLLGLDPGALARHLVAALGAVPGATFAAGAPNETVTLTVGAIPPGWQAVTISRVPLVPVVSLRLAVPLLPADLRPHLGRHGHPRPSLLSIPFLHHLP